MLVLLFMMVRNTNRLLPMASVVAITTMEINKIIINSFTFMVNIKSFELIAKVRTKVFINYYFIINMIIVA